MRVSVILYAMLHCWFDACYDGSVKMQVMYHSSHYLFVAGVAIYSAKGSLSYRVVLTSVAFVFLFFATKEMFYFYDTLEAYNNANSRAIDYYDYSFLFAISFSLLWLMERRKNNATKPQF